jgi:hypothetical protein
MATTRRLTNTLSGALTVLIAAALLVALPAAAGDYPVVDTAQTQCYDDHSETSPPSEGQPFYGQDAQYLGNQPSYTLSGDGLTVHDNVTGLTWMASPDGNGDGILESPEDKMSWWDALDYTETLNAQSFGGYDDWRLPSIKELYSLIDFRGLDPSGPGSTGTIPYIDTDYFEFVYGDESDGERIIDSQYWTSTEYVWTTMGGDHTVFGVNFADGRIKSYPTDDPMGGGYKLNFVLCCRGNSSYAVNDFVDNGDGTVTDEATGLMWQQADSGSGMQWEEALAYAEGLSLAGHDDWRLPNAKELQSIVDYTRSPDYTGSAAVDPVFSCTGITNEELDDDYPWYWSGTTHLSESTMAAGRTAAYVCFGRGMGYMFDWVDAHGAGCQRSDPKSGSLSEYTYVPYGYYFGDAPQGDAIRLFNYVRCVRDSGDSGIDGKGEDDAVGSIGFAPNPFRDSTELTLALPVGSERATCVIYDVRGRTVRTLEAVGDGGEARLVWDGRDGEGTKVVSGVYFALTGAPGPSASRKLVLLR